MVREDCINPWLINSGSRAHLLNTTEAKGKALLWLGKAKKKKQDESAVRDQRKRKEVENSKYSQQNPTHEKKHHHM